jgi:hypothetical protein
VQKSPFSQKSSDWEKLWTHSMLRASQGWQPRFFPFLSKSFQFPGVSETPDATQFEDNGCYKKSLKCQEKYSVLIYWKTYTAPDALGRVAIARVGSDISAIEARIRTPDHERIPESLEQTFRLINRLIQHLDAVCVLGSLECKRFPSANFRYCRIAWSRSPRAIWRSLITFRTPPFTILPLQVDGLPLWMG